MFQIINVEFNFKDFVQKTKMNMNNLRLKTRYLFSKFLNFFQKLIIFVKIIFIFLKPTLKKKDLILTLKCFKYDVEFNFKDYVLKICLYNSNNINNSRLTTLYLLA